MRGLLAIVAVARLVLVAGGAAADTFAVRLVSQDATTITLGWDPQPGYGYLFSADGNMVSRTNDPNVSQVTFSKQFSSFDIDVLTKGVNGHYQPSSPPTAALTISPSPATTGQQVTFDWTGSCGASPCSVVWEDEGPDGPGGTDYPLGTGDPYARAFVNVGTKYIHLVVTDQNGLSADSRQQLTVTSGAPPPP